MKFSGLILVLIFAVTSMFGQQNGSHVSLSLKVENEIPDSILTPTLEELTIFSESPNFQLNRKLIDLPKLRSLSILVDGTTFLLPDWIKELKQVEELYVKWSLSQVPTEIYELEQLKALSLIGFYNELPAGISALKNLEYLNISSKKLQQLPDEVFSLNNLKFLGVTETEITVIPEHVNNLTELEFLDLGNNLLEDCAKLSGCKKLQEVNLHENRIAPFVVDKIAKSNASLKIKYNYNFQKFTNNSVYTRVVASSENVAKSVKAAIKNSEKVEVLDLSKSGKIEKSLKELSDNVDKLSHIKVLKLSSNKLSEVPAELGQLKGLKELYLNDNELAFLPPSLYENTAIRILEIDDNFFPMLEMDLLKMHQLKILKLDGILLNPIIEQSISKYLPRAEIIKD